MATDLTDVAAAALSDTTPATRPRRRPGSSPGRWAGLGFAAPLVAYLVVLYGAPLYENVSMSLHRYTRATFVTGQAPYVGLDIYREVLGLSLIHI